jgi:hypothetical protein
MFLEIEIFVLALIGFGIKLYQLFGIPKKKRFK